eukprot:CAMPEP_0177586296 /NCGR_PEP_ID=MMETSP0419_2-20121207/4992_1 /TAXON_ID=582737 /ORGANISM="Tetraselmis sp., Strain GSL018" /LENGTH=162 /DNA_ID=CAMNT_0019076169 /DNA_START=443 /DNA_END=928 /DNA_ORIENTATION=+
MRQFTGLRLAYVLFIFRFGPQDVLCARTLQAEPEFAISMAPEHHTALGNATETIKIFESIRNYTANAISDFFMLALLESTAAPVGSDNSANLEHPKTHNFTSFIRNEKMNKTDTCHEESPVEPKEPPVQANAIEDKAIASGKCKARGEVCYMQFPPDTVGEW